MVVFHSYVNVYQRVYPESTNHVWYIYGTQNLALGNNCTLFIMAIAKASIWHLGETSGTKWQPQRQAQRQYPQRWWEDVTVARYFFYMLQNVRNHEHSTKLWWKINFDNWKQKHRHVLNVQVIETHLLNHVVPTEKSLCQ